MAQPLARALAQAMAGPRPIYARRLGRGAVTPKRRAILCFVFAVCVFCLLLVIFCFLLLCVGQCVCCLFLFSFVTVFVLIMV